MVYIHSWAGQRGQSTSIGQGRRIVVNMVDTVQWFLQILWDWVSTASRERSTVSVTRSRTSSRKRAKRFSCISKRSVSPRVQRDIRCSRVFVCDFRHRRQRSAAWYIKDIQDLKRKCWLVSRLLRCICIGKPACNTSLSPHPAGHLRPKLHAKYLASNCRLSNLKFSRL